MLPTPNFKNSIMLSSLILFGCTSTPPVQIQYPPIPDIPQNSFANIAAKKTLIGRVL